MCDEWRSCVTYLDSLKDFSSNIFQTFLLPKLLRQIELLHKLITHF